MAAVVNYRYAKAQGLDDVVYIDRRSHILEGAGGPVSLFCFCLLRFILCFMCYRTNLELLCCDTG